MKGKIVVEEKVYNDLVRASMNDYSFSNFEDVPIKFGHLRGYISFMITNGLIVKEEDENKKAPEVSV